MYLETPAGGTYSYVVDRINGDDGTDAEFWQGFDPENYVPAGSPQAAISAGNPDIEG